MSKLIFVHFRRAGITRAEMNAMWSSDHQLALVGQFPGLTKWVQNHVISPEGEAACDGIGELWFDSDGAILETMASTPWKEAVEDAKRYANLETSGAIIVQEKVMIG